MEITEIFKANNPQNCKSEKIITFFVRVCFKNLIFDNKNIIYILR